MFEKIQKGFFIAAGSLFLGIGAVGVFLPVLPTTPFLLLAAACFFRGSDRMYSWLLHHPWFGRTILNYRQHRAVSKRAKIVSISALWFFIGISAVFAVRALWHKLLLVAVAAGVTVFLLALKNATSETAGEDPALQKCRNDPPGRSVRPGQEG